MSNIYVTRMKNALSEYYNKELSFSAQIADIFERFTDVYAEDEAARVRAQSEECCQFYKNKIVKIFEEVREALAVASFPDPGWLTADRTVFDLNAPFVLSPAEVAVYVDKYTKRENYSMLRMISDWIAQKNTSGEMNPYRDIRIYLPSDHLMIYKKFADSALSQIETIHQNVKSVNPDAVSYYADENFASEWYSIIGNGQGLKAYHDKTVEDAVRHSFDTVTLSV